jgi:hypothetical protein
VRQSIESELTLANSPKVLVAQLNIGRATSLETDSLRLTGKSLSIGFAEQPESLLAQHSPDSQQQCCELTE